MRTLKLFPILAFFLAISTVSFSQNLKTETIPVSGNCAMCKSNIEKAARKAGATEATWNVDEKVLTVKYNSSSTNTAKIQKSIAAAGYDTRDVKANESAYTKLNACCKYGRTAIKDAQACAEKCGKDGKCDMAACKDKGCCKEEADCKDKGCCAKAAQ